MTVISAYYFSVLRRGGKAYYALDITNADAPVVLWKKENVAGVNDSVWDELGETWSKPTLVPCALARTVVMH